MTIEKTIKLYKTIELSWYFDHHCQSFPTLQMMILVPKLTQSSVSFCLLILSQFQQESFVNFPIKFQIHISLGTPKSYHSLRRVLHFDCFGKIIVFNDMLGNIATENNLCNNPRDSSTVSVSPFEPIKSPIFYSEYFCSWFIFVLQCTCFIHVCLVILNKLNISQMKDPHLCLCPPLGWPWNIWSKTLS